MHAQVNSSLTVGAEFVSNIIETAKMHNLPTVNGKYVVAKQKYCQEQDCYSVFDDYKDKLYFYSTEDRFLRNVKDFIIIERYNINEGAGKFGIMKNDTYKVSDY